MRLLVLFATILAIALSLAQAQNYNQLFAGFGPYLRQQQQQQPSNLRDPRSNTGPVLFPPGPPGNPADTSGVIVGASGYGFVPPNAGLGLHTGKALTPLQRPLIPPVKIITTPYRSYFPAFYTYFY
ncbi:uncharacterized protein LOC100120369 isoform X1 [Nasonia vitripennis]|uniref:Uncharacterized protein n=1 Tax=Nasonia vitripennis TaxID=7425 RepID=A0A7M7G9H9_NASVI|nr:uncharacterized protein LOC100120369 isoform X1 [Nasonia vitripennis]